MKKLAIAAVAILMFTGCSTPPPTPIKVTETPAAPVVTTVETPEPVVEEPEIDMDQRIDDTFIQVMCENLSSGCDGVANSVLFNLADSVCEALDAGNDMPALIAVLIDSGMTAKDSGTVIGTSVAAYCPEYTYLLG